MSLPLSIPKRSVQDPIDPLLTVTRTAFGLGPGRLMADRIKQPLRQAAAIALMSVGALAAVPLLTKLALAPINRPDSDRATRARLRSIRRASAYACETAI